MQVIVDRLQHRAKRLKRYFDCWLFGAIIAFELFCMICWAFNSIVSIPIVASVVGTGYFLISLIVVMTFIWDDTGEKAARTRDKRMVGPLLDALDLETFGMTVTNPLLELMPSLHAEDASLLSAEQYGRIYRILQSQNEPLVIASLNVLAQVSDKHALACVSQMIKSNRLYAKSEAVRSAADRCLTLLQERASRDEANHLLLRPSGPANIPNTTLLRAAHSGLASNPDELLRP